MRNPIILLALCFSTAVQAEKLSLEIRGLDGILLSNATATVENLVVSQDDSISQRRLTSLLQEVESRVDSSLRPLGYYHARTTSSVLRNNDLPKTIVLDVNRGSPVRVAEASVQVNGPGASLGELQDWRANWPLTVGAVLDHSLWEGAKQEALSALEYRGYIEATFTDHRIEIDLDSNEARLFLALATGPRAVMGEVRFEQEIIQSDLLTKLPRFNPGQPYDGFLLEKLRQDLWRTGFFTTVEVVEEVQLDRDPPVVDLVARLTERNRDSWQGSIGVGSDTELRAQANWTRHWLSERGDSIDMGVGWQQRDDRYLFKTNYRLPRQSSRQSYWIAETLYRDENQDFEVSPQDEPDMIFKLTSGDLEHYLFKGGILNIRDLREGYQQISETWFVQYLRENVNYNVPEVAVTIDGEPLGLQDQRIFRDDNSSIALGGEWDWPVIQGRGFQTVGHHQRASFFTADKLWGSNREFGQAYLSSRWNFLASDRLKLLFRAELGYSDATVEEFDLAIEDDVIGVSLTELPNFYRFKAGGSQSVRGYAYESLSNNGIGSNNIITFSAEAEWLFRENWSLAAFYDIGNAFNDWSDTDLKQGAGFGVRWYTIAGAVRLDLASGLDLPGDPWRVHFTLGVPLL